MGYTRNLVTKVIDLTEPPTSPLGEFDFLHARLCLISLLLHENGTTENPNQFLAHASMVLYNEYWHKQELLDLQMEDLIAMQTLGMQLLRYPHLEKLFNDTFIHNEAMYNATLLNSDDDCDFLEGYFKELFPGNVDFSMEGWENF